MEKMSAVNKLTVARAMFVLFLAINFHVSIAQQLEAGKKAYQTYCVGCHGDKGDGNGPAAMFLDPKPRDFTSGKFKFASVPSGQLPRDEDIHRVIKLGLSGTSMPAWPLVPETERNAMIEYLKTFYTGRTEATTLSELMEKSYPELDAQLREFISK